MTNNNNNNGGEPNNFNNFLSVLTPSALNVVVVCILFQLCRKYLPRIYFPRIHLRDTKYYDNVSLSLPPVFDRSLWWWWYEMWRMSDGVILNCCGVDAMVFIRFLQFCLHFLCVCGVYMLGVLVAVNRGGSETHDTMDSFTIINVTNGSIDLWWHVTGIYYVSIVFYCMVFRLYISCVDDIQDFFSGRKLNTHMSKGGRQGRGGGEYERVDVELPLDHVLKPQLHTVLVCEIPEDHRSAIDVERVFSRVFPGKVAQVHLVCMMDEVRELVTQREDIRKKLQHAQAQFELDGTREKCDPNALVAIGGLSMAIPLLGDKVDAIEFYDGEMKRLEALIQLCREKRYPPTSAAFVTFQDSISAVVASTMNIEVHGGWQLSMAPVFNDVIFDHLILPQHVRALRSWAVLMADAGLVFFFGAITLAVTTLTSLKELEGHAPFIASILDKSPALASFLQGFLPTLVLLLIMKTLSIVLIRLSKYEGPLSQSGLERGVLDKLFFFLVVNAYFAVLLGGSVVNVISKASKNTTMIFDVIGKAIPSMGTFFMQYIILNAAQLFLEVLQPSRAVLVALSRKRCVTDGERAALEDGGRMPVAVTTSNLLLMFVISLSFCVLVPLIVPCAVVYFGCALIVWKNQVLYVYRHSDQESNGQFLPMIFTRMCLALAIAQISCIGVLSLKQTRSTTYFSVVMMPLPIVTYIFYSVLSSKFLNSLNFCVNMAAKYDATLQDRRSKELDGESGFVTPLVPHGGGMKMFEVSVSQTSEPPLCDRERINNMLTRSYAQPEVQVVRYNKEYTFS